MNARQAAEQNELTINEILASSKEIAVRHNITVKEAIDKKIAAYIKYAKTDNERVAWEIRGEAANKKLKEEGSAPIKMKQYSIAVMNGNSGVETHTFEAENDSAAIDELNSYKTPQDDGKAGKYELELFEVTIDDDDSIPQRFVTSIHLKHYV